MMSIRRIALVIAIILIYSAIAMPTLYMHLTRIQAENKQHQTNCN